MGEIAIVIAGNVAERRTEAEIYWRTSSEQEFVALVFDTEHGWQTEIANEPLATQIQAELAQAVERARLRLTEYVNRRGENAPEGLTVAGLSFWLMEKSDGTAMGNPIGE